MKYRRMFFIDLGGGCVDGVDGVEEWGVRVMGGKGYGYGSFIAR